MKKKILGVVVVVAIAVGAMINLNLNKVSNKGDLTLANVEALAQSEGGGITCNASCHTGTGQCWMSTYYPEYQGSYCKFSGCQSDHCQC
jgi:hypothetical protein